MLDSVLKPLSNS